MGNPEVASAPESTNRLMEQSRRCQNVRRRSGKRAHEVQFCDIVDGLWSSDDLTFKRSISESVRLSNWDHEIKI
jgi:hypothetical protein